MRSTARWLCLILLCFPAAAAAQPVEPIGPFVVDARGTLARFKGETALGGDLGIDAASFPSRGLGLAAGAHWYPLRLGRVTLGLGGEVVLAGGSRAVDQTDATGTTLQGPTVTTRFSSASPHLSLNFGHNDGWSYLSGGIGLARLTSEREDRPFTEDAGRVRALHYGGGARWFNTPHVAFTFDLRFYTVNAQEPTAARPGYPRMRFMVISVGASIR